MNFPGNWSDTPFKYASSEKFVGGFRHWPRPKCMK